MEQNRILRIIALALAVSTTCAWQEPSQSSSAQPTNPPQRPLPERVRVSAGVMAGLLISKVAPDYPENARRKHIHGTVTLSGEISKEGEVTNLTVISGDPKLSTAAIDAVKKWKYRPYLLNGTPVIVVTSFQVNFQLSAAAK
jgi:periplasmic protein TonB